MSRSVSRRRKVMELRIGLVVVAVLGWYGASAASPLIASPLDSVRALVDQARAGALTADCASTLGAMLYGFVASVVIGIPIGYAIGRSRLIGAAFEPVIASLFAVPRIIFYPLLLGVIGVGATSKAWLAAISAVFPIIIATAGGVRQVAPILSRLGSSLGSSRLKVAWKIVLPAALPPIMGGVRIGFGVAFVTVIIAELFVAASGLGLAVRDAYSQLNLAVMYGDILFIVAVAFVGSLALWAVERRLQAVSD